MPRSAVQTTDRAVTAKTTNLEPLAPAARAVDVCLAAGAVAAAAVAHVPAQPAVAAGISAVFLETHLDPATARSDRATVMPIDVAVDLIGTLTRMRAVLDA